MEEHILWHAEGTEHAEIGLEEHSNAQGILCSFASLRA